MRNKTSKLTLYEPASYEIKVPGVLDGLWVDESGSLEVKVDECADGQSMTILTGQMDQARLQGLLRHLYGLGLPLISVNCEQFAEKRAKGN